MYSNNLFDLWDKSIERNLLIPDYSLSLQVEEGSIKGNGHIAVWLTALYLGIGNYGSFVSGLNTIREQANSVGDYLAEVASAELNYRGESVKVRKRGGTLGALQRLFVKVQRGELTPEQATIEAEFLLGDDAHTSPEFMEKLRTSLDETPVFHQQIALPLEEMEEGAIRPFDKEKKPRRPHERQQRTGFRVEISRGSKRDEKTVRVRAI